MKKSSIPNIFTFINLGCGVLAILSTFEKKFLISCIFIIIAALVDRYDGRVARYLDVSSDIGKQLDSLADLVSFGVAPSILTYILFNFQTLGPEGILGYCLVLLFPICGAFRLARYNVTDFDGVFTGIPITIAGSFVTVLALIDLALKESHSHMSIIVPIIFIIAFSYLMISKISLKKI